MKLLNIVDVKGELTLCVLRSNITSHYARAQNFLGIFRTGMKLPRGEKESIKYTLPRDAAFRLPAILKSRPL